MQMDCKLNGTIRRGSLTWLAATITLLVASLSANGQIGAEKQTELYLIGESASPVKIEVFSDYQCPACRAFYMETLKPLITNYADGKKVGIVYHDYPLDMHPYARPATRLALAAARLGRERWLRVTDALYANQPQWSQDGNIDAALAKVLDPDDLVRVKKMAAEPSIEAFVEQELIAAHIRNVTSTPTFFIISEAGRQQRVNGGVPYPVLKDYLDRLLKQ